MQYSTLERAFQLAQHGPAVSLDEIRIALTNEGYHDAHAQTGFPQVRKQLRDAITARKAKSAPPAAERRPRLQGVLRLSL